MKLLGCVEISREFPGQLDEPSLPINIVVFWPSRDGSGGSRAQTKSPIALPSLPLLMSLPLLVLLLTALPLLFPSLPTSSLLFPLSLLESIGEVGSSGSLAVFH